MTLFLVKRHMQSMRSIQSERVWVSFSSGLKTDESGVEDIATHLMRDPKRLVSLVLSCSVEAR
jgi:hypothetical protein